MLRPTALLFVMYLLVGCSNVRGPGVPGGGGGVGLPPPIPDGGTLGDAETPFLVCQAIPAAGLTNEISVTSSFDPLTFNLAYVFARWDCSAAEPAIQLGMSDTGCSFGSGQRLIMNIPALPTNADSVSIAEGTLYVRPNSPAGRCGFDEGSFIFDVALLNPERFKAEFTLTSLFLRCDQDLDSTTLTITGAFDIELGHTYDEACTS